MQMLTWAVICAEWPTETPAQHHSHVKHVSEWSAGMGQGVSIWSEFQQPGLGKPQCNAMLHE